MESFLLFIIVTWSAFLGGNMETEKPIRSVQVTPSGERTADGFGDVTWSAFLGGNMETEKPIRFVQITPSGERTAADFGDVTWSAFLRENMETGKLIRSVEITPSGEWSAAEFGDLNQNKGSSARHVRSSDACAYPRVMEDSLLHCRIYPSRIICQQKCVLGYTFPEGTEREMSCINSENRWTPYPIENCQPYVDCTLTLLPGGSDTCYRKTLKSSPYCDIACMHYEDKDAVPEQRYHCDINGRWSPELPFCASAGTGLILVPRPINVK